MKSDDDDDVSGIMDVSLNVAAVQFTNSERVYGIALHRYSWEAFPFLNITSKKKKYVLSLIVLSVYELHAIILFRFVGSSENNSVASVFINLFLNMETFDEIVLRKRRFFQENMCRYGSQPHFVGFVAL